MIAQRLVVVADAHFASPSPEGADDEAAFRDFLRTILRPGDALLLAGDLYDFWFSYHHVIPRRSFQVTAALAERARDLPVLMLGGNHDRWGGTFWSALPGITFDPMLLRFAAAGRQVLAIHGDGLHEHRPVDRLLNRLIRSRLAIGTFRRIPPEIGFAIGHSLGHAGRAEPPAAQIAAAAARQLEWARRTLEAEPDTGLLVMGHTHLAVAEELFPGRWYLNPGPWLRERRYAIVDADGPRLARFT